MRVLMTLDLGSEGRTEFEISMFEGILWFPRAPANDGVEFVGCRDRGGHCGRTRQPLTDSRGVLSQLLEDANAFLAERAYSAQRARTRFHVVSSEGEACFRDGAGTGDRAPRT